MPINIIHFPRTQLSAANDDGPDGPGGAAISMATIRQRMRIARTLRGVFFNDGEAGIALAA